MHLEDMFRPPAKYFSILLLLTFAGRYSSVCSQTKTQASAQIQNLVQTLPHDTCLDKKFSVVFYLMQDSLNGLPAGIISYSLPVAMQILNTTFSNICVSFEHCKTVVIPNHEYLSWEQSHNIQVINNWYTENTINIYVPAGLVYRPDYPENAYTPGINSPTLALRNAIVIDKQSLIWNTLPHVMGHFFGLPHTSDEINPGSVPTPPPPPGVLTYEYVDRTDLNNCYTHGDGFCDTEADPFSANMVPPPALVALSSNGNAFPAGMTDGKGNYFVPPLDNYMSFNPSRCRFSQEQYNFMAKFIVNNRMYLH